MGWGRLGGWLMRGWGGFGGMGDFAGRTLAGRDGRFPG